jgi:hypothetical protein
MKTLPEHEQLNGQPAFGYQRVAEADRYLFAKHMDRILKIVEKLEVTFATRRIILIDAKATSACLDHVVIVMSTALAGVRKDASRLLQLVGEMWSISDSISSSADLLCVFLGCILGMDEICMIGVTPKREELELRLEEPLPLHEFMVQVDAKDERKPVEEQEQQERRRMARTDLLLNEVMVPRNSPL